MKNLKNVRYTMSIIAACAAFGMTTDAKAQTVSMDATVTVQNTLTLTEVTQLNYGTLAAFKDTVGAQVASIIMNPDGTLGVPTTTGAPAAIAVIDNTAATQAEILIEDGADGATVNVTINNVVAPTNAGNPFALSNWRTSTNGAAPVARVVATPFGIVYLDNAGAGSTLEIGARLGTVAGGVQYADLVYSGTFDVVFSY